ncbi:secretion protein [Roseobacter sp. HKCCA0434]|uniref:secretion protein n=1 Tax=Roseobacter sp. HKCCA0434 TaxID=3079297 RepID=UPI002905AE6B|nr:secretion protein [Roseobacter sp. HKCCA0434]
MKRFAILCATVLALAGCEIEQDATTQVEDQSRLTEEFLRQMEQAQRGELVQVAEPYYGGQAPTLRGVQSGEPLPNEYETARGFIVDHQRADIAEVAAVVTAQTGIPVNVRTVYAVPGGSLIEIPIGTPITLSHEGTLSRYLDRVAARTDTEWFYDGAAIIFDRMVTRTFQVPLPTGSMAFSSSVNGLSDSGTSVELTRSSDQDPWGELEARLAQVAAAPSNVVYARNAGTVSVFGPPSVQREAERVVEDFDAIYSTRIGLEVGVYLVDVDRADEFEAALNVARGDFTATGVTGTLLGAGVGTVTLDGIGISLRGLSRNRAVVDFRQGSSIAQSGVWSPIVLRNQQNFVSSQSVVSTGETVSQEIETSTIDTGISIHALPRIVSNGDIQLNLTLVQRALNALDTFSSNDLQVQLPNVDERALQSDAILSPGETLILSGYEQDFARRDQLGTGAPNFVGLGGRNNSATERVRMVVLVRLAIIGDSGR